MNLSPSWISLLEAGGYETKHWSQIGSPGAPDTEIMQWARGNGFVVFTHDLDYGALLFATQTMPPSVIQLRIEDIRPKSVGEIVLHLNPAIVFRRQLLKQALISGYGIFI